VSGFDGRKPRRETSLPSGGLSTLKQVAQLIKSSKRQVARSKHHQTLLLLTTTRRRLLLYHVAGHLLETGGKIKKNSAPA